MEAQEPAGGRPAEEPLIAAERAASVERAAVAGRGAEIPLEAAEGRPAAGPAADPSSKAREEAGRPSEGGAAPLAQEATKRLGERQESQASPARPRAGVPRRSRAKLAAPRTPGPAPGLVGVARREASQGRSSWASGRSSGGAVERSREVPAWVAEELRTSSGPKVSGSLSDFPGNSRPSGIVGR